MCSSLFIQSILVSCLRKKIQTAVACIHCKLINFVAKYHVLPLALISQLDLQFQNQNDGTHNYIQFGKTTSGTAGNMAKFKYFHHGDDSEFNFVFSKSEFSVKNKNLHCY